MNELKMSRKKKSINKTFQQKKESEIEDKTLKFFSQKTKKTHFSKWRKAYLNFGIPSKNKNANH